MLLAVFLATTFCQIGFIRLSKTIDTSKLGEFFPNPLWGEYQQIAKEHNLDLNFAKYVWQERGPANFLSNQIFKTGQNQSML